MLNCLINLTENQNMFWKTEMFIRNNSFISFGETMKRKINPRETFRVVFRRRKDTTGEIELFIKNKKVGTLDFYTDTDSPSREELPAIIATDLKVDEEYQNRGFGSFLIYVLQSYATMENLPIKLFSVGDKVNWYLKRGFVHDKTSKDKRDLIWYPPHPKIRMPLFYKLSGWKETDIP